MKNQQIKRKRVLILTALLILTVVLPCFTVCSEEVLKGRIDVTLIYESSPLVGVELHLYRVADLGVDGSYILTGDFSQASANLNSASAEENREQADFLYEYAQGEGIDPFQTQITDKNGAASFTELPDGKYLLVQGKTPYNNYLFMHTLIEIPFYNEDDVPIYEIDADPKIEIGERVHIGPYDPEEPGIVTTPGQTGTISPPSYDPNDPNDPNHPDNPNNPNNPRNPYNPNVPPKNDTPLKLFGRIPFTGVIIGIAPVLISFIVLMILFFLRKRKAKKQ